MCFVQFFFPDLVESADIFPKVIKFFNGGLRRIWTPDGLDEGLMHLQILLEVLSMKQSSIYWTRN